MPHSGAQLRMRHQPCSALMPQLPQLPLTSLHHLSATTASDVLRPRCWDVLHNLRHLATLHLFLSSAQTDDTLGTIQQRSSRSAVAHILEAALQLQDLGLATQSRADIADLCHISKLSSLAALGIHTDASELDADAINDISASLGRLAGLTHSQWVWEGRRQCRSWSAAPQTPAGQPLHQPQRHACLQHLRAGCPAASRARARHCGQGPRLAHAVQRPAGCLSAALAVQRWQPGCAPRRAAGSSLPEAPAAPEPGCRRQHGWQLQ